MKLTNIFMGLMFALVLISCDKKQENSGGSTDIATAPAAPATTCLTNTYVAGCNTSMYGSYPFQTYTGQYTNMNCGTGYWPVYGSNIGAGCINYQAIPNYNGYNYYNWGYNAGQFIWSPGQYGNGFLQTCYLGYSNACGYYGTCQSVGNPTIGVCRF